MGFLRTGMCALILSEICWCPAKAWHVPDVPNTLCAGWGAGGRGNYIPRTPLRDVRWQIWTLQVPLTCVAEIFKHLPSRTFYSELFVVVRQLPPLSTFCCSVPPLLPFHTAA